MTPKEKNLIRHLLRGGAPTVGEFHVQLEAARAVGSPPVVMFDLDPRSPRAKAVESGLIEGRNRDPHDPFWRHVLLWIANGRLASLEIVADPDATVWAFPDVADVLVDTDPELDLKKGVQRARDRHLVPWSTLIAIVAGVILGLVIFGITECVGGRCQGVWWKWVPLLEDLRIPEDWVRPRRSLGSALMMIGVVLTPYVAVRITVAIRRRFG